MNNRWIRAIAVGLAAASLTACGAKEGTETQPHSEAAAELDLREESEAVSQEAAAEEETQEPEEAVSGEGGVYL